MKTCYLLVLPLVHDFVKSTMNNWNFSKLFMKPNVQYSTVTNLFLVNILLYNFQSHATQHLQGIINFRMVKIDLFMTYCCAADAFLLEYCARNGLDDDCSCKIFLLLKKRKITEMKWIDYDVLLPKITVLFNNYMFTRFAHRWMQTVAYNRYGTTLANQHFNICGNAVFHEKAMLPINNCNIYN